MKKINFAELTKEQQQAFCDFQLKESYRHLDDIKQIDAFLKMAKEKHGIIPRKLFVNTRID